MLLTLQEILMVAISLHSCKLNLMQHLPYRVCFARILLASGTFALQGSKGGIGPHQVDATLALVLHNNLLAKAVT